MTKTDMCFVSKQDKYLKSNKINYVIRESQTYSFDQNFENVAEKFA
jgi:hypothetical protein